MFSGAVHLLCATASWFPTTANNPSNEIFLLWWPHWQQWDYHDFTCPVLLPFNNRHSIQVFLMRCIYKSCHTFFPSQPPCLLPNSNSPTCIRSFEKCRGRKIWEMECILASAHQVWLLWWIQNWVSKGFDSAMKTGSSRRFKRYPTTYRWESSQIPFTED